MKIIWHQLICHMEKFKFRFSKKSNLPFVFFESDSLPEHSEELV